MALDASSMHGLPQCALQTLRAQRTFAPVGSHIMLCVVDHYEPSHGGAGFAQGLERVNRWVTEYQRIFGSFRDADAAAPRHTFFFPMEEYTPEYLDRLRVLCDDGKSGNPNYYRDYKFRLADYQAPSNCTSA